MKDIRMHMSVLVVVMGLGTAVGQPAPGTPIPQVQPFNPGFRGPGQTASPSLPKFDLDFAGGSPKDLVTAIQKSMGKPVNAIVPEELASTKLPALKMKNVDVQQLFMALEAAGRKSELIDTGRGSQTANTAYGFRSGPNSTFTEDVIWYFYVEKPLFPPVPPPPKVCRFYSLASYLEQGTTVDDITTAIKTGAKMLGEGKEPEISFHKDTKLLIAVGEPSKLEIIDSVLRALEPAPRRFSGPSPPTGQPVPRPQKKAEEQ